MSNILLTITGPTCAGKTTLQRLLVARGMQEIVSFTTRPPREGEVDGKDYWFVNPDAVDDLITGGEIAEHITLGNYQYGILTRELTTKLAAGHTAVVVEPNGAHQLHNWCIDHGVEHKAAYITNPINVLVNRFLRRFSDDKRADFDNYTTRLLSLMKEDDEWGAAYNYDIVCSSFNDLNHEELVEDILRQCGIRMSLNG
jgi:guanylate kinase